MDKLVSPPRKRLLNRLTDLHVKRIKKPGDYADGGNLYLHVSPEGTKSFSFQYERHGKRRYMGLGGIHVISLREAREKAREAREVLSRGEDPLTIKKAAKAAAKGQGTTLGQCGDTFQKIKRPGWRENTAKNWAKLLALKHCQALRQKSIAAITTDDIKQALAPLRPVGATLLRGKLEMVLDYAIAHNLREGLNPARWKGNLEILAPQPEHVTRHHPALDYRDVPTFMQSVRKGETYASCAVEFAVLTATRSSDVRRAQWSEVDLAAGLWTVPGARHKSKADFAVPLSRQCAALLEMIGRWRSSEFLFERALDSYFWRKLVPEPATLHGFRSSFSDWAAETTEFSFELVEMSLAHKVGNLVARSYRRTGMIEPRRILMQAWADYCDGVSA